MFRPDHLTLSAYVDGELDSQTAAEIEVTAAQDTEIQHQLDDLLRINAMVRVAYDEPLHEAVPGNILAAIMDHPVPAADVPNTKIIPLPAKRRKIPLPSGAWATAAAAAIALVVGIGGTLFTTGDGLEPQLALTSETQTIVRQMVNEALETMPNGQQAPIAIDNRFVGSVTPLRTYINTEGQYCRDYIVALGLSTGTSTACRLGVDNWRKKSPNDEIFGRT